MEEQIKRIDDRMMEIDRLIIEKNNECAEAMANITGGADTRILSYAKEQELQEVIEKFTGELAKLIVEREELEEEKKIWLGK